eukprot:SAG31_NODE_812_length_11915_cov_64.697360_6_plen_291_part_00
MSAVVGALSALACVLAVTAAPQPLTTTKFTINVAVDPKVAEAAVGQDFVLGHGKNSYAAKLESVQIVDAHRQLQNTDFEPPPQVSISYVVTCGHMTNSIGIRPEGIQQDCGSVRNSLEAMYQTTAAATQIIDAITSAAMARSQNGALYNTVISSSAAEVAAGGTALLPPVVDLNIRSASATLGGMPSQAFPNSWIPGSPGPSPSPASGPAPAPDSSGICSRIGLTIGNTCPERSFCAGSVCVPCAGAVGTTQCWEYSSGVPNMVGCGSCGSDSGTMLESWSQDDCSAQCA